jgi:hypothetical protein
MNKLLLALLFVSVTIHAQPNITLEDIFVKGNFRSKSFAIESLNDGKQFVKTKEDAINKQTNLVCYDLVSGNETKTLFKGSDLQINGTTIAFDNYTLSNDEKKNII